MKKKAHFILFCIFVVGLLCMMQSAIIPPDTENFSREMPKNALIAHETFSIGNEGELNAFPNKTGAGTPESPYIIENLLIDAQGQSMGIELQHTWSHLIIRNCTILNALQNGIVMENGVHNIKLLNNTIINCSYGVSIGSNASNYEIKENIISQSTHGMYLGDINNTIIQNNTISNVIFGIYSGGVYNTQMIGNEIYNIQETGIRIGYAQGGPDANITVQNNIVRDGLSQGLVITHSSDIRILNNSIFNHKRDGVALVEWSHNIVLQNNTIFNNGNLGHYGMLIEDGHHINITGNSMYNNSIGAIGFTNMTDSSIRQNYLSNNFRSIIINASVNVIISENTLCNYTIDNTSSNIQISNNIIDSTCQNVIETSSSTDTTSPTNSNTDDSKDAGLNIPGYPINVMIGLLSVSIFALIVRIKTRK